MKMKMSPKIKIGTPLDSCTNLDTNINTALNIEFTDPMQSNSKSKKKHDSIELF